MRNEERPRITITAERHDELVAAEVRLKELHGAGLRALELVGRTMIELARARQAGRRLAGMHKKKHAELEKGHFKNADPHGRIVDTAKLHLDFNGTTTWKPNATTTWTQTLEDHAVCDGAVKPDAQKVSLGKGQ